MKLSFLLLAIVLCSSIIPTHKTQAGEVCNYRNDTAYLATAFYHEGSGSFRSEGWWKLETDDCLNISSTKYTYISYDDYGGYATPPRLYGSKPKRKLCVLNRSPFKLYRAENERECREQGGRMETFLKYGSTAEYLRYNYPGL